jgi:hypothetical protein
VCYYVRIIEVTGKGTRAANRPACLPPTGGGHGAN